MIGFDRVARVLLHDMTAASSSPHHGKTSPFRRYQRTATMMTSGGKRKLAKPAWQAWLQLTDLGCATSPHRGLTRMYLPSTARPRYRLATVETSRSTRCRSGSAKVSQVDIDPYELRILDVNVDLQEDLRSR